MTDDAKAIAQEVYDGVDPDDSPCSTRREEVDEEGRKWLVIRSPKIPGQPRAEFWLPEKDPPPT